MARKTKEEAQATREGILDAALTCFHEHGISGTTLAAIGERAGYSRGAVYWHFKNKAEVLEGMISRERVRFVKRLRHAYSPHRNTPIEDLRSAMLISVHELATDLRLRQLMEIMLRNDLSPESTVIQNLQHDSIHEELEIMRRALERARLLGQLREGVDIPLLARILHASLVGVMTGSMMLRPQIFDLERDSRETMDALLAFYVKPGVFTPGTDPQPLPPADADADELE